MAFTCRGVLARADHEEVGERRATLRRSSTTTPVGLLVVGGLRRSVSPPGACSRPASAPSPSSDVADGVRAVCRLLARTRRLAMQVASRGPASGCGAGLDAVQTVAADVSSTSGGTRPARGRPARARARMSVDETSGVVAVEQKHACFRALRADGVMEPRVFRPGGEARDHPRREPGQPVRQGGGRHARARAHDEVREVEHGRVFAPRGNFCKRIGAGEEENLPPLEARCACSARSVSAV